MPMTPTASRIFAISLTDRFPLLAQKKSSQAVDASLGFGNSPLEERWVSVFVSRFACMHICGGNAISGGGI